MNAVQKNIVEKCRAYIATQDPAAIGIVARMLGAQVRAARTDKSRRELMAVAEQLQVIGHSDYIVSRFN